MKSINHYKTILPSALLALFLTFFLFSTAYSQTADEPPIDGGVYQISTLNHLYWIAATNDVVPSPPTATRWAATISRLMT